MSNLISSRSQPPRAGRGARRAGSCRAGARARAIALVGALAAPAACGPTQVAPRDREADAGLSHGFDENADDDHDGYRVRDGDCDDRDPLTHPGASEICFDHIDQNCDRLVDERCDDDHDGYAIVAAGAVPGGDCDDLDRDINPGAWDVAGNGRDDDCDGVVDQPHPSCDIGLGGAEAQSFAASIELCPPWLLDARWNHFADPAGRALVPRFGVHNVPAAGESMALLSTGIAYVDKADRRFVSPRPGTAFQDQEQNPLPVAASNVCTGGPQPAQAVVNDLTNLTLTVRAPTNARAIAFRFNFFSAEYSDFVGSQFNDAFVVRLDSGDFRGNIVFDDGGQPITVNSGFFAVCLSQPICDGVAHPRTVGHRCAQSDDGLNGTGYDDYVVNRLGQQVGGATGWLSTRAPITPGETLTLQFMVYDGGLADHLFDSTVLIDDFHFIFAATVTAPSTG